MKGVSEFASTAVREKLRMLRDEELANMLARLAVDHTKQDVVMLLLEARRRLLKAETAELLPPLWVMEEAVSQ